MSYILKTIQDAMTDFITKYNSMTYDDMLNLSKVGGSIMSVWLVWKLMNDRHWQNVQNEQNELVVDEPVKKKSKKLASSYVIKTQPVKSHKQSITSADCLTTLLSDSKMCDDVADAIIQTCQLLVDSYEPMAVSLEHDCSRNRQHSLNVAVIEETVPIAVIEEPVAVSLEHDCSRNRQHSENVAVIEEPQDELNTSIEEIMSDISDILNEDQVKKKIELDNELSQIMNTLKNDKEVQKMIYMLNNGISWYDYMYPNGE